MTRLLISTALAGILSFAGAAYAQDRGNDHRDRGKPAAPAAHAAAPAARPAAPAARGADQRGQGRPATQNAPAAQPQIGGRNGRGFTPPPAPAARNAPAAPAPSNAMRGPDNRNAGNRGPDNRAAAPNTAMRGPGPNNNTAMRGTSQQRNFSSLQRNFNAPRRFHAATYNRPRGWYSHRWTYGEILPALFWASDYWLNDYMDYGLEPPPPGTLWVRDGGDALLIVRGTGEIIQVDYGVFY